MTVRKSDFKIDEKSLVTLLKGKTILIIDDNQECRQIIEAYLKRYQVQVIMSEELQQSLELMKSNSYDLIFMDVFMPEFSGLETTEKFREWEKMNSLNRTPIIAVSLGVQASKALEAGCDVLLQKPLKKLKFLETISSQLSH